MAKLFLSYAREDAAVAQRLARGLERSGQHDVWWDRDLLGGASFGTEIEQQLRDCDAVIVIWSASSAQSPWVRDEAAIGREAGKLIPVTLGKADPPIGFRQFHTIDIGQRGRASAAAIEKIERAVEHLGTKSGSQAVEALAPRRGRRISGRWLAVAIATLILALIVGALLFRSQRSSNPTVAIVPVAGQPRAAADYANAIAADIASFLSAQGNAASVLDPNDAKAADATYRFNVSYSPQGQKADTSVSMAGNGQQGILWSQNWSSADPAATNLKKQMSFAAARALLCAIDAKGGGSRLSPASMKLYIVACSGLYRDDASYAELAGDFARLVGQQRDFAPAWDNLAIVRSMIFRDDMEDRGIASPDLRGQAQTAIARARQLNPNSGKSLFAEAILANGDWRNELTLLDRAIALEPSQALFYAERSYALQNVGRMNDAIADAEKAVQLDPLSPAAAVARINALMYGGRLTSARDAIASAYKVWPDNTALQGSDLGLEMRYGDPRRAEQLVGNALNRLADQNTLPVRRVLAAREDPTPAKVAAALDTWRGATQINPGATTHYFLTLGTFGKFDDAFRFATNPKSRPFMEVQSFFRPEFAPMRRDPRFMALAAQYGLAAYWKSTGNWPDFCFEEHLAYDCKTEAAKFR